MKYTNLSDDDMDVVQGFAFGGIANPSQRATLRTADREFLAARQKELDAFDEQRQAYNTGLTKYQEEVYKPYQAQAQAYNEAAKQYNTDVYEPYQQQYGEYEKAITAFNEGDRTSDYAGPAEPVLARAFEMKAPTTPGSFDMSAPELPFKEEEVQARQQAAAQTARRDAGDRATAINVASNPEQFGFGSMSVSSQFMAKGGSVNKASGPSARDMLDKMSDPKRDAALKRMVREVSANGKMSERQVMEAVKKVSAAGRGGDELLAYLSPESRAFLKSRGGAGTTNPLTGLLEFKGATPIKVIKEEDVNRIIGTGLPAPAPSQAEIDRPYGPGGRAQFEANLAAQEEFSRGDSPAPAQQSAAQQLAAFVGPRAGAPEMGAPQPQNMPAALGPMSFGPQAPAARGQAPASDPSLTLYSSPPGSTAPATGSAIPTPPSGNTVAPTPHPDGNTYGSPTSSDGKWFYSSGKWFPNGTVTISPEGPITTGSAPTKPQLSDAITQLKGNDKQAAEDTMRAIVGLPPLQRAAPAPMPEKPQLSDAITRLKGNDKQGAEDMMRAIVGLPPLDRTGGGAAPAPADSGGGEMDLQVIVYGPDGKMYSSPSAARRAGVKDYTMEQPAAPPPANSNKELLETIKPPAAPPVVSPPAPAERRTLFNRRGSSAPGIAEPVPPPNALMPMPAPNSPSLPRAIDFLKGGKREDADAELRRIVGLPPLPVGPTPMPRPKTPLPITGPTPMPTPGTKRPRSGPVFEDFQRSERQEREREQATNPTNYFARSPLAGTGNAPGTVGIGSQFTPLASTYKTQKAIGDNPNLSPGMLGGRENAGVMTDRLGNQIMAPAMPMPIARTFAEGGEVEAEDDTPINTDPLGSAQQMLAQLTKAERSSPTRQSVKRLAKNTRGKEMPKEMGMGVESLTTARDLMPKSSDKGSSRQQMEDFIRVYQLKVKAAKNKARGLAADTFGAPTLEGPSLTKNTLAKKRFAKGGEAKKPDAAETEESLTPQQIERLAEQEAAEREAASRPAFVTPKSGIGRKLSSKPGELEAAALQGIAEMPYNLLGTPVDLATMAMRPFGYNVQAPMLGSEDLKRRATKAGIRQEPPKEGTAARALFNLTDIGSSAVNPAAPVRAGVKAAKIVADKATDVAKDFQEYNRQLAAPGASYAVRPTGSTLNMAKADQQILDSGEIVSRTGSIPGYIINSGKSGVGISLSTPVLPNIQRFWDGKAQNYFERQFGTPDDPIANALIGGRIKGGPVSDIKNFPKYITEQTLIGKTRQKEGASPSPEFVGPGAPETRFYPKFPDAVEDLTRRYDEATGLKGLLVTNEPGLTNPDYTNITSNLGAQRARETSSFIEDKMMGQGVRPDLINTETDIVTRSEKDPTKIIGPAQGKKLLEEYEKSLRGEAADIPESTITAIQKGEPIYDAPGMKPVMRQLFNPERINQYLETLPAREIDAMRFEDVVANTNKMFAEEDVFRALDNRIRSGKKVPDNVFLDGVSSPLLQFDKKSGFDGFAWKRLETPESTVPEGAYIGHSVGGYKLGGATYSKEKMQGFKDGLYQVYTLRDNRNRPVNTIEVKMLDEFTPVVTQIKGNGRASGNTAPEKYDGAVLRFLQTYLKPAAIEEYDRFLTPLLQNYKTNLGASPRVR